MEQKFATGPKLRYYWKRKKPSRSISWMSAELSASSVGAVGEPTQQQRKVEPLLRVTDGKHNLETHTRARA